MKRRRAVASVIVMAAMAAMVAMVAGAMPNGLEQSVAAQRQLPRLQVSGNHRFLVTTDGRPFFWLGDTAWELFHRLDREEAERYLQNRASKGYTVIQAVVLAESRRSRRSPTLRPASAARRRPR